MLRKAEISNSNATDDVSTGTPGSKRKHRSNHLIGQLSSRPLNGLPSAVGFCIDLRARLSYFGSRGFARLIESSVALCVALLGPLFPHPEDLSPRQTQFVGVLRCLS